MDPKRARTIEELQALGTVHGFTLASEYHNALKPLTIACTKCSYKWTDLVKNLKASNFKCARCEERAHDPAVPLEEVLQSMELPCDRHYRPEGEDFTFSIFTEHEATPFFIEVVSSTISGTPDLQTRLEPKITYAQKVDVNLIVIDDASVKQTDTIEDFLVGALTKPQPLLFSNEDVFRYRTYSKEVVPPAVDSDDEEDADSEEDEEAVIAKQEEKKFKIEIEYRYREFN